MSASHPMFLITGAMAAGKSTIGQHLAERFEKSIHLRGDAFRRMVVNGRVEMSANPSSEALAQLLLRYRAGAETAKLYSNAGFTVIYQDTIIGPIITDALSMFRGVPIFLVVLCPSREVITNREARRAKTGYGEITVNQLQIALDNTPRLGLWIDSSDQSVEETTKTILENLEQAKVVP